MKLWICRFFAFLLFVAAVFFLTRGVQQLTGGMRRDKVAITASLKEPLPPLSEEVKKILSQNFSYLDKGSQTYVYLSDDKKYVLKLMRFHRYKKPFWMRVFESFQTKNPWIQKREEHRYHRFIDSMNSYHLADEKLRKETELLYAHLSSSRGESVQLTIKDRLGRIYKLDANETIFILQKSAQDLRKRLLQYKENSEEIKRLFTSFIEMTLSCYHKGIVIKDYNCLKNAGYLEGRIVNIDLGSFYHVELTNDEAIKKELLHFTKHFYKWANKHYPEAIGMFEEVLAKYL